MVITKAETYDIPGLETLMNSAYRGEDSRKGWTTEAHLLEGEKRTDAATLRELMSKPDSVILKYSGPSEQIEGCVYLQNRGSKLYLGMLSVNPLAQAKGIGKKLMHAAVDQAKKWNCESIIMQVISVRHELIAWYERQGFSDTGQREPFPNDNQFGIPTQPLEFMVMEKKLVD